MAVRPKDVYRGRRRKPRWLLTLILFIIALVIVGTVGLFYFLQRFVVITNDEVYLDLPWRSGAPVSAAEEPEGPSGAAPGAEATVTPGGEAVEIIFEDPDFSSVDVGAGEDLKQIGAMYVAAGDIDSQSLSALAIQLSGYGANAMALELKSENGMLLWSSQAETALSFGTSGTLDLAAAIAPVKEQGVYLIAELSCCVDDLMALRNYTLALHNSYGGVYSDSRGAWLDPYNRTVRSYIADLAVELAAMGFDEILLSNLEHPVTEDALIYSQQMSASPDPVTAVCNFALDVREAIDDYNIDNESDVMLSALVMGATVRDGLGVQNGQDTAAFMRIFDRMFCDTSAGLIEGDRAIVAGLADGDMELRFVPVTVYQSESPSWMVTLLTLPD